MPKTPSVPDMAGMPTLFGGLPPKAASKVSEALDRLAAGVRAGGIQPSRYDELAHTLWSTVDRQWEYARLDARPDDLEKPAMARAYEALRLHGPADAASVRGRIAGAARPALRSGDAPAALDALDAMAREAEALALPLLWLRDRATKLAPAAPKGAEPPPLPPALGEAQEGVVRTMRQALEELREGFAGEIAKVCRAQSRVLEDHCGDLRDLRARVAATPKEERTDESRREATRLVEAIKAASWFARDVRYDMSTYAVTRHPDGEDRILRFAEGQADEVLALCIARNAEKLAPLVAAMGETRFTLSQASVDMEGVRTDFRVAFAAGGGFRYTNSIVYATSNQGKPYVQYPARFHDVVRPDGTPLKGPSEAAVRRAFQGPPEASDDEEAAPGPRM